MRHTDDGTLRRLLDEPAGVADADRTHVAGCATCLSALATMREDATLTGAALHNDATADVDAGWRRLSAAMATEPPRPVAAARPSRWRAALRSPVIAVVGVAALLTGASAAAAADWLQIFRAERVAPVVVNKADLMRLPDLSAYGTLSVKQQPELRPVAGAAAAAEVTGLTVPQFGELPRGVAGEPSYQAGGPASAEFTFSTERAARTAEAAGTPLPAPPAGLNGSKFRFTAGPGFAAVWTSGSGAPAMIVGRAIAPTVYSTGVPFATARDYLLALPGMPEAVAAQLRSFSGDGKTLPLIVKADRERTFTADVGGVAATVLANRDGTLSGVVWVEDGVVTVVGGSLSADEVLSVARGLRW